MVKVTAEITEGGVFSEVIIPRQHSIRDLNVSIKGTFVATVKVQRRFKGETGWGTLITANSEYEGSISENENGVAYKIGVDNGDYTSGTIYVRLSL